MTCRPKKVKPEEQLERERQAAQEAVRRHRARRQQQIEAIGRRRYNALRNCTTELKQMVFGKNGRAYDRTHLLAKDLVKALQPQLAERLRDHLTEALTPEEQEKGRRLEEQVDRMFA